MLIVFMLIVSIILSLKYFETTPKLALIVYTVLYTYYTLLYHINYNLFTTFVHSFYSQSKTFVQIFVYEFLL